MESLPDCALHNILRFCSHAPLTDSWPALFGHAELAAFADPSHPLGRTAQEAITGLLLRPELTMLTSEPSVWAARAREIVLKFGPRCTRMSINMPEGVPPETWMLAVQWRCFSLKELYVHATGEPFKLNAFVHAQKALEELALRARSPARDALVISAAASNRRLRRLRICIGRCNPPELMAALASAGRVITSLAVDLNMYSSTARGSAGWKFLRISELADICPRLMELELRSHSHKGYSSPDVARALTNYGAQLQKFAFPFRMEDQPIYWSILHFCPNLMVYPELIRRRSAVPPPMLMTLFGPKLACVAMTTSFPMTPALLEGAAKVSRLRSLAVVKGRAPMDDLVRALFHNPQEELKFLRLHFRSSVTKEQQESLCQVLFAVAMKTSALQRVCITATSFDVPAWLRLLADRNKGLRSVNIAIHFAPPLPTDTSCACHLHSRALRHMLVPLLPLKHLSRVTMDIKGCPRKCQTDTAAIAKVLLPLRHRNVAVAVNGVWLRR